MLGLIAKWLVVAGIWGALLGGLVVAFYAYDLPDVHRVAQFERRPAITLLAADGSPFRRYGDLHGTAYDVRQLPAPLVDAVLAVEDRRFHHHFGIDPIGLARAAWTNWRTGRTAQGGSTLTQQLAKNLFLGPERSLRRKVQEALLALWLEHTYSKDQILTAYLNRVYLGAGTFGVDAAARTYFGKPVTEINLREAATLAGLLKAPSRYAPTNNPDEAWQRAQVVLGAMVDAGYLTAAEAEAVRHQPPAPRRKPGAGGDGRYLAEWVADQIGGFLGYDYGDVVVRTTVDLSLQRLAEARVDAILAGPGAAARVEQAALVALAPDGAVKAMVGGRDYGLSQFNRATQALRQPGSAFKPFVFLAALEAGFSPDSTIEDAPLRIGKWAPANFEKEFRGAITLTDALAHSVNTAAVRLLDQVGLDRTRDAARRLGITSPLGKDLGLALGTSEVTPLELTAAYAAIANGGSAVWPYAIQEISDRDGRVLYRRQPGAAAEGADPRLVAQLTGMMEAVVDGGTGKAARLDRPAAGKTGTTSDYRDAWFVGFTADLVAGVWMGNDDNSEMKRITGGSLPAQLWRDFMREAHAGRPPRPLNDTVGGEAVGAGSARAPSVLADDDPPVPAPARPAATSEDGIAGLLRRLTGGGADIKYDYPKGRDN